MLTVTSVGGAVGQPFADAYCGAKFAVEGFMQSLAVVMLAHGVHVSRHRARCGRQRLRRQRRASRRRPGRRTRMPPSSRPTSRGPRGPSPTRSRRRDAAAAIADAATSTDYRFRWQTSEGATAFVGMSLADTDGSRVLGATRGWIETAPN